MQFIPCDNAPFIPASHEDPLKPGVLKRVIADRHLLHAGQVPMLNWSRLPAGSSFRRHYHEDMQEIFILLSGCVVMNVEDESVTMNAGDTVIVEPREVHEMQNIGSTDADYLVFGIAGTNNGRTVVVE
ncbi:MAG: cupin domain-containing protein [Planctomyces sp.]